MSLKKILSYTQKILAQHEYKRAIDFFFYAQTHQKEFAQWLAFVEKLPGSFSEDFKVKLVMRGTHRFLRAWLGVKRLDVLMSHYALITQRFSPASLAVMQSRWGVVLTELTGKSGKKYPMHMIGDISKDGAVRLIMRDADDGTRLASITGALGRDVEGKEMVFWVGALQGGSPQKGREAVSAATKDLNGLRPKQAVLQAVAALALFFEAKKILGPSLKNQIAIKNWRKGGNIHTEYEEFWREYADGATDERGDYVLPLPLPRRKLEEVQQKRRKDWQLRYARVDAMAAGITESLKAL